METVLYQQRLRPQPSANARGCRERGWGPASTEKCWLEGRAGRSVKWKQVLNQQRLRPQPSANARGCRERGWGPASSKKGLPVSRKGESAYQLAQESYAEVGVNADAALSRIAAVPISLHCWQGDDVGGFENPATGLGGGLAATGNYPGQGAHARRAARRRAMALSLIPGQHRFNLHAIYGEIGGKHVDRDAIAPEHFAGWIDWAARARRSGSTSTRPSSRTRRRPTVSRCRTATRPSASSGSSTASRAGGSARPSARRWATPCVTNLWIPDGMKDTPADRAGPRERLAESLDAIFAEPIDPQPTWTRSRASCSASAARATWSARTSSTSATR